MNLSATIAARFPALRSRDFVIFWVGQFFSLIGTWMQSTAQPYLVYRLTGSSLDLGMVGFATTLPTLLIALPGGVIVERLDKRTTVIVMQAIMMVQAFIMAYLALTDTIQVWHIIVLAFILGSANAIEITARQAMLIELVGKDALPNAIALQATIFNAARVLGPSVVAPFLILLQNQGEGWAFFANGASYLIIILGLFFVNTPFKEKTPSQQDRNIIQEFKEGQAYIRQTNSVFLLIIMAAVVGFVGFPFIQQIPAIARDVLAQVGDTSATVAGRNSALYIFQGVGALTAAIILASFNPRRKGLLMTAGQTAFIFGLIFMGLSRVPAIDYALLLFIGWGTVTQLATMNTLLQLEVPNELRGRVFSTYLWALQGVAPFGSLTIGWVAQNFGVQNAALICGGICLVAIGGIHLKYPSVRAATGSA